jgi:hypothetical protein
MSGDQGPRPAWQDFTCHFCLGHISKGSPVQWSMLFGFWGHPVCVHTAEEEASADELDAHVAESMRDPEYRDAVVTGEGDPEDEP